MLLMAGCATVVITVSSKACSTRMHPFIAMEVMLCMTSDLSKVSGSKNQARTSSQQLSCCSQHKRSAPLSVTHHHEVVSVGIDWHVVPLPEHGTCKPESSTLNLDAAGQGVSWPPSWGQHGAQWHTCS